MPGAPDGRSTGSTGPSPARSAMAQSKRYTKVDTKCASCHKGWTPRSFKHEITSLKLDDTHRELDCESCHLEGNFANPPSCAGCHDDKAYPETETRDHGENRQRR